MALLGLLFAALAPQARAGWQCEGRACGTSPWVCCCESPADLADAKCDDGAAATRDSAPAETVCFSGCACVVVIEAAGERGPAALLLAVASGLHPAVLSAPLPSLASPARRTAARVREARAPPACAAQSVLPSLRAPPAA